MTDPIIELGVGQEIVMEMVIEEMTGMIVGQIIEETISDSTIETKGIEREVYVRIMTGPDKGLEIIQGTAQEIEINTIVRTREEVEIEDRGPGVSQEIDKDQDQIPGLDLAPI